MTNEKVFIIAEAGVNHNGDPQLAMRLVEIAHEVGADAVKFQTFKAERLVSKHAPKADYQLRTTDESESHFEMIRKLELSEDVHRDLQSHCQKIGITFLSSPFDAMSARFLNEIGMPIFKIPSGEATNIPYLKTIGAFRKPVILSTGMCTLGDIEASVNALTESGAAAVTLLHCNSEYPTPFKDVNLKAMETLRNAFRLPVGYSDHTNGIEVSIAAVALGALVIEKHLTLDRGMPGPDHSASLGPAEFRALVTCVRNVELSLGDGVKRVTASEMKNISIARKSIVAARRINRGQILTQEDIDFKRPGTGLPPRRMNEIVGRTALRDFEPDELLEI